MHGAPHVQTATGRVRHRDPHALDALSKARHAPLAPSRAWPCGSAVLPGARAGAEPSGPTSSPLSSGRLVGAPRMGRCLGSALRSHAAGAHPGLLQASRGPTSTWAASALAKGQEGNGASRPPEAQAETPCGLACVVTGATPEAWLWQTAAPPSQEGFVPWGAPALRQLLLTQGRLTSAWTVRS